MNAHIRRLTGLGALAGLLIMIGSNLGTYPWLQQTWWFAALATFVMINTLGFATLAAIKLGIQSGRRAALERGSRPEIESPEDLSEHSGATGVHR